MDPIGMTPFEVWNYLLPLFVSGKKPGESTGMFGQ
jgi:hypothetical protein